MAHWYGEDRKAAKSHVCVTCYRTIEAGEQYRYGAGMDGSTAWSWHQCAHCNASLNLWYDHIVVWEEWDSDDFQIWATERVTDDLAEARAQAGWRNKWRLKSGKLWPIPTKEKTNA